MSDTKTALLDSAEASARQKGFDGFSYADLSEEVGIRKASIHYHFPTKADLSVALMKRYRDTLQKVLAQVDAENETAAERLKCLVQIYREALNGGKTLCLCVSLSISRDSLEPDVIKEIRAAREMVTRWVTGVFELGKSDGTITLHGPVDVEATAILPLLEGAQLAARAEENTKLYDAGVALLLQRLN